VDLNPTQRVWALRRPHLAGRRALADAGSRLRTSLGSRPCLFQAPYCGGRAGNGLNRQCRSTCGQKPPHRAAAGRLCFCKPAFRGLQAQIAALGIVVVNCTGLGSCPPVCANDWCRQGQLTMLPPSPTCATRIWPISVLHPRFEGILAGGYLLPWRRQRPPSTQEAEKRSWRVRPTLAFPGPRSHTRSKEANA